MRQKGLFILALLLIMPITVFADSLITKEAIVVEAFDGEGLTNNEATGNPVIWKTIGSKFSTEGYPVSAYANAYPADLFGKFPENAADLFCYGILGSFTRTGYNNIEIIPGEGQGDEWKAEPLMLPGKIEYIDLWVWGSNYNYTLDLIVKDYRGIDHIIEMGSIKHIGWKHLYVKIPTNIPQTKEKLPMFQGLKLTKLVIRTDPKEKVDRFAIYFDQLKVITDTYNSSFDGDDLDGRNKEDEIFFGGVNNVQ